jgi:hypothetical protein
MGDIRAQRSSAAGYLYFGSSGSSYAGFDGSSIVLSGGPLVVGNGGATLYGNCNITGQYQVNGVPISTGGITTQSQPGYALNTVYQNTTGKPKFVVINAQVSASSSMNALTDGGNPPGTVVANVGTGVSALNSSMSFWVLPNNYYEIQSSGVSLLHWTEWY